MDLFEEGKKRAQEGHYEEALDAFMLALENDRENADIHFFLGLCYSSLEQFPYAKYHYEMALMLKPDHEKTRLVFNGLNEVASERPPEKRITKQAAAKLRRDKNETKTEDLIKKEKTGSEDIPQKNQSKITITDEKWETAFPSETLLEEKDEIGIFKQIVIMALGIMIVASLVYFILSQF